MGNTGADVSIIVGCGSKRRGWGAIMGIGGIVRSCVVEEDGGWMGAFKTVLIKSAFTSRRTGTKGKREERRDWSYMERERTMGESKIPRVKNGARCRRLFY